MSMCKWFDSLCGRAARNDFIGEKKNMEFDFKKFHSDKHLMRVSSVKEFNDFVDTLKKDAYRETDKHLHCSHDGYNGPGYYYYDRIYITNPYPNPPTLHEVVIHKANDTTWKRDLIFKYKWSDFMKNKKFTKADLKNGDVVKRRNGIVEIACVDVGTFIGIDGWNYVDSVKEDLTHESMDGWDIVKVRRPNKPQECQFCAYNCNYGTLIYDRERDDPEIEEMTMEDVCKALGKRVKIVDRK